MGGQLNNIKDDTSTITAISESEEVSISGGKIYAKNTNSSGRAFAISMLDKTKNYHYQVILIYLLKAEIRMDRYIMVV